MGDISAEPSMEDILSSIKRIIAEEGDAAMSARGSRRSAPAPAPRPLPTPRLERDDFGHDEILELSDPVRGAALEAVAPQPMPIAPPVAPAPVAQAPAVHAPQQVAAPAVAPAAAPSAEAPVIADPILSPQTTQASRGSLETLSRLVVKPEIPGADTLEGLVRELLRPMLRDWLDANLPALVEQMVAKEIARITGQN